MWINWLIIALGLGVTADGIGSIVIKGGQYHALLFDEERYVRVGAGVALVIIGILIHITGIVIP